jgi:polysaccharide export outer membrane protein
MPTFTEAKDRDDKKPAAAESELEPSSAPGETGPRGGPPSSSESRPAASDSAGPLLAPVPERRPPPLDVSGDYRVRPGDRLEVQFHEHWKPGADYRLLPGDQIHVEFLARPERSGTAAEGLDRTVRIQPDGKVAMPFLGMVEAAGRTVPELADLLSERYERLYVDPHVLVTLVSTGDALAELRDSLRTAAGRAVVVAPDGAVRLPHLSPIPAAGLKTTEIEYEINERCSRLLPGFAAKVRLAPPE